ncbi:hypothetical protein ACIBL6_14655 [Streptomyces sp. NPDC050400]|uniref:hypothetical protein n=1 Tax=Streptomyces sp. NPDC050400 TaxID=3365610 RepID=UPI003795EF15
MSEQPPVHNEFNGTIDGDLVQTGTIGGDIAPPESGNGASSQTDEVHRAGEQPPVRNIANGHFKGDVIQASSIHSLGPSHLSTTAQPADTARSEPAAAEPQKTEEEPRLRRYFRVFRPNRRT